MDLESEINFKLINLLNNGSSLAWVDSFKYLVVNISRTNILSKGLNAACQQARKAQKVLDNYAYYKSFYCFIKSNFGTF